jgi:peptide deformylase
MAVREILGLGNPSLYEKSAAVAEEEVQGLQSVIEDLHDTMMSFRQVYNAGRAIAAPQIGVMKRLVYMNIHGPVVFFNPRLAPESDEMMEVWDDCMCFPELLVMVRRYRKCRIYYRSETWEEGSTVLEDDLSELLQHEVDHLDGILAISRAIDARSFALRNQKHLLT